MEKNTIEHFDLEGIYMEARGYCSLPIRALDITNGDDLTFTAAERTCIYDAMANLLSRLEDLLYPGETKECLCQLSPLKKVSQA